MRFAISIVAALMILGLAAFGVVSAQKMSTAPSQATASDSAAAPAPQAAPAAARRHPVNPVSQVAQAGPETPPAASAPAASAPAASVGSQCSGRQRSGCCRSDAGGAGDPDDAGRSERRLGAAEARAFGDRHSGVR